MTYEVDWKYFDKSCYDQLIAEKLFDSCEDIFYGRVYVGQLCFDVNTYDNEVGIYLDCYVPFKKGYGEKELDDGTHIDYDEADGIYIDGLNHTYEEFVEIAEAAIEEFINTKPLLVDRANKNVMYW